MTEPGGQGSTLRLPVCISACAQMEMAAESLSQALRQPQQNNEPVPLAELPGCAGLELLRVALSSLLWVHDSLSRLASSRKLLRAFITSGAYEALLCLSAAEPLLKRGLPELPPLTRPSKSRKKEYEAFEREMGLRAEHMAGLRMQVERERRVLRIASQRSQAVLGCAELGDVLKLHVKRNTLIRRRGVLQAQQGVAEGCRTRAFARRVTMGLLNGSLADFVLHCLHQPPPDVAKTAGQVPLPFHDLCGDTQGVLFQLLVQPLEQSLTQHVSEYQRRARQKEELLADLKDARSRKLDASVDLRRRLKAAGREGRCEWQSLERQRQQEAQQVGEGLRRQVREKRRALAALFKTKQPGEAAGGESRPASGGAPLQRLQYLHLRREEASRTADETREQQDDEEENEGEEEEEESAGLRGAGSNGAARQHGGHVRRAMAEEERRMAREEQKRRREAEKARRALEEAKQRQEMAARIYEGWHMNREDQRMHELDEQERRARDAALEVRRMRALRQERVRLTEEERRQEEEALRQRKEAEARKIQQFRQAAKEMQAQEERMQAQLQEQMTAAIERWRAEKLARDIKRREEEKRQQDKVSARHRQLLSLDHGCAECWVWWVGERRFATERRACCRPGRRRSGSERRPGCSGAKPSTRRRSACLAD